MMKTNIKHIKIDKTECTHFDKKKLCAFILQVFKNAIDCMMIDIPLNDNIPEHSAIDVGVIDKESSLAPLVTSIMPYKNPFNVCCVIPNCDVILERVVDIKQIMLKASKSSVIR